MSEANLKTPLLNGSSVVKTADPTVSTSKTTVKGDPRDLSHPISESNGQATKVASVSDSSATTNGSTNEKADATTASFADNPAKDFPWRSIGNYIDPSNPPNVSELKKNVSETRKTLQHYVFDKYYSDIYWNSSLMFGTCFFAWLLARFGGSVFSLIFVLICSSAVYRTEFRRFNRNLRDDMTRAGTYESLDDKLETMEWLNSFLAKFWVIYMPALSEMVITQATNVLKDVSPPTPIDKLSLDEFTLGTKAPKVESIRSFTKLGKDTYQMDWDFGFTPNDTDDMTKNELKKKIDPKVALGIRVGKGFVGASLPILVEDMSFKGRMRITFKLGKNFPHINMVSVSFLEPPSIDYALKPVGGNTFGLDIMSLIPGLASFVNSLIHSNLAPMLYAPNSLDINVEEIMEGAIPEAIGCLSIKVKGAEYSKKSDINPYFVIAPENDATVSVKTDIKGSTDVPVFNEQFHMLINSVQQRLRLTLMDFRDGEHLELGETTFELMDLLQKATQTNIVGKLTSSNKTVGKVVYDLNWLPVLQGKTLGDGTTEAAPDSESGILKFTLHSGENLDRSQSMLDKLSTYAEIYCGDELISKSRVVKGSNEPDYDVKFEKLLLSKSTTPFKIIIKDTSSYGITQIGEFNGSLNDILMQRSDYISIAPIGKLRVSANWKSVALSGTESASFVAPMGCLRLHIRSCNNLKNLETIGTVDPYVRVLTGGHYAHKTSVADSTLNPVYNSVAYIPIISENQELTLDCMDVEQASKDRSIGSTIISLSKYIKTNENGNYLVYEGSSKVISKTLYFKETMNHGSISYSISFYPTIPVYSKKELKEAKKEKEVDKEEELKEMEEQATLRELAKAHPNDYEWYTDDEEDDKKTVKKLKLDLQQLLSYNSGFLGINLLKGTAERSGIFVQVLFDDNAFPSFTTKKALSKEINPFSGTGFIRDLSNSVAYIRISKKEIVTSRGDVLAEKEFKVTDLLKNGFEEPTVISLSGYKLKFQFEYIPTAIALSAGDSMLDTGDISIEVVSASGLKAADSNGKSDPFVKLYVDGRKVLETKTKKKTLDPVWNESIAFKIPSRARTEVKCCVFDWDLAGDNDFLGECILDLSSIDVNKESQFETALDTQGKVLFKTNFRPHYNRPQISEDGVIGLGVLSDGLKGVGAGAAGVVGAAGGVTGAVVGGVGGAAVGTVTGVGGGLKKGFKNLTGGSSKKQSMDLSGSNEAAQLSVPESPYSNDVNSMRSGRTSPSKPGNSGLSSSFIGGHNRNSSDLHSMASTALAGDLVPGRVTVVSASGLNTKTALVKITVIGSNKIKEIHKTKSVKVSDGEFKWHESASFKAPTDATLQFTLRENHTFGKAVDIDSGTILLSEIAGQQDNVTIALPKGGSLVANFNYSPHH